MMIEKALEKVKDAGVALDIEDVIDAMENGNLLAMGIEILAVEEADDEEKSLLTYRVKDGPPRTAVADVPAVYLAKDLRKFAYITGVETHDKDGKSEWKVSSCQDVTGRELAMMCGMNEEESNKFEVAMGSLSEDQVRDFIKIAKKAARFQAIEEKDKKPAYYTDAEREAKYLVLKKVLPPEVRDEIERCLNEKAHLNLSSSERKIQKRVCDELLSIDWTGDGAWDISADVLEEKLKKAHVGHSDALRGIISEITNTHRKTRKTLNFIGPSQTGKTTLAVALAEAIGRPYTVVNFAGIKHTPMDAYAGSMRNYENARFGFLYEKLKEINFNGTIIFSNIDQYSPEMLQLITPILEGKSFFDNFFDMSFSTEHVLVICTSTYEDEIVFLKGKMRNISFHQLDDEMRQDIVNAIYLPRMCEDCHIRYEKERALSKEVVRKMACYAHMDMSKLEDIVHTVVGNAAKKGGVFPRITLDKLNDYYPHTDNKEEMKKLHATSLNDMEDKFFALYDSYPETVQQAVIERLNEIHYGRDQKRKEYYRETLRYLVNVIDDDEIPEVNADGIMEQVGKTHYKLEWIVKKIIDAIQSSTLSNRQHGMLVIGLQGAPGVGKTSLGSSIAKALHRTYVEICLAGIEDPEVIRGKRGFGPGIFMRRLSEDGKGSYYPFVLLDEFDKLGRRAFEPLHEICDPNQISYHDDGLDCDIPTAGFVVIVTFNDISRIPDAILNRMHTIIACDCYTMKEKETIANQYAVRRLEEQYGFDAGSISMTQEACAMLIKDYSTGLGVRDISQNLQSVITHKIEGRPGRAGEKMMISTRDVRSALGGKRTRGLDDMLEGLPIKPGQARALAVTDSYSTCFLVETVSNPYQKEAIKLTGLPKGSCLEAVSVAETLVNRRLKKKLPKLHIHFTNPGIAKDGPSAGVCIYFSIMSYMLEQPLPDCAFTGAIDLFGNVGIIGGVKAKISAAERSGVETVYIPGANYDILAEKNMLDSFRCRIVAVNNVKELTQEFFGLSNFEI